MSVADDLAPGDRTRRIARLELLRALGAVPSLRGDARRRVEDALGLEPFTAEVHTEVFVLECPPYASLHLGAEGMLGGDAADRAAGFARALDLEPSREPDHLATLLDLYSYLGEAGVRAGSDAARSASRRSCEALLFEHLWSWIPGYLAAVCELERPPATAWASLLMRSIADEVAAAAPPARLPLALRLAPEGPHPPLAREDVLTSVTVPLRAGIVLTRSRLRAAASALGAGMRVGERRYALGALIDQEPEGALAWLAAEAGRWAGIHDRAAIPGAAADPARWWSARAATTGAGLAAALGAAC